MWLASLVGETDNPVGEPRSVAEAGIRVALVGQPCGQLTLKNACMSRSRPARVATRIGEKFVPLEFRVGLRRRGHAAIRSNAHHSRPA